MSQTGIPSPDPPAARKDDSQLRQKRMIADHFRRLAESPETGEKSVYTFVPGNLTELLRSFDLLPVLPEINALQSGMRGKSRDYISLAEKLGHSEDVCTYVKCDIGMMKKGNIGPTGTPLPEPDLLLLSYTGCFTFMKWFELLKEEYDCPVTMLHVPYQGDGVITDSMRRYVVDQLRKDLGDTFEILRASQILIDEASFVLPGADGFSWSLTDNDTVLRLEYIPEPATSCLFLGASCLGLFHKLRRSLKISTY